jgi:ribosomal-protein-alanine N-acetyltransferase
MLADIHKTCFAKGWDKAAIGEMLGIAGTVAFVEAEGRGFALLRCLEGDAEILTLAVLPGARRLGIGVAMVNSMRAWAAEQGGTSVFLEVGEHNEAAVALYGKCGFSTISRRKGYYRGADGSSMDALVMRLNLVM